MERPLRILMVNHLPLDRRLGGSRVQIDLGEALREQGHRVDTYSSTDAFPEEPRTRAGQLLRRPFWSVAPKAVRKVASRYDIIDAQQGDLPVTKTELGFDGLLVARSVGLVPFYDEFERSIQERWPDQSMGNLVGRTMRAREARARLRSVMRSFETADLVNTCNEDERAFVAERLGSEERVVNLQFGLSDEYVEALSQPRDVAALLRDPTIVAAGTWDLRKGGRDWPAIIKLVRSAVPNARFHFIGTGRTAQDLLGSMPDDVRIAVEVTPRFDPSELPRLLTPATVAGLPSYIEGFPFVVLETLAAGVPTVAYDVPGPRETLRRLDPSALVPAGDAQRFSDAIVARLRMDPVEYRALAEASAEMGQSYRWGDVASATLDVYSERLAELRMATPKSIATT